MTFAEYALLSRKIAKMPPAKARRAMAVKREIDKAHEHCTLQQDERKERKEGGVIVEAAKSWRDVCNEQRELMRIPESVA